jgi:hypothetical protein
LKRRLASMGKKGRASGSIPLHGVVGTTNCDRTCAVISSRERKIAGSLVPARNWWCSSRVEFWKFRAQRGNGDDAKAVYVPPARFRRSHDLLVGIGASQASRVKHPACPVTFPPWIRGDA